MTYLEGRLVPDEKYETIKAALDLLAADNQQKTSEDECLYSDKQCPGYVNCTYPEKETYEGLCALSPRPIMDALEFWCQLVKISIEGTRTSIPIQATALITDRDKWIRQDEKKLYYDIFVECLEAMQERRLYADAWEYKYKNRWDKEEAMITTVIKGIKDE